MISLHADNNFLTRTMQKIESEIFPSIIFVYYYYIIKGSLII